MTPSDDMIFIGKMIPFSQVSTYPSHGPTYVVSSPARHHGLTCLFTRAVDELLESAWQRQATEKCHGGSPIYGWF